jgi:hypothetical protein
MNLVYLAVLILTIELSVFQLVLIDNVKAFHLEAGITDEEGNQDVESIISFCDSILSSQATPTTNLNTCDVTMVGINTLCEDHGIVFSSCSDPRLQIYLSDRNLLAQRLDLQELLNLFDEYRISP